MKKIILISLCLFQMIALQSQPSHPKIINTASPWTYWWWHGSAVDKKGITAQLEQFKKSGLGGAHIIPIYGVKGYESQFRPFLSKEWLEIFRFTCSEANRLGLGIDLSTGTGWPFGGPGISKNNGAKQIIFNEFNANDTVKIKELLLNAGFSDAAAYAIDNDGIYRQINKTELERLLINPDKQKYLSITYEPTKQMVKRAAPGGEGLVVDHFDPKAMKQYLSIFDSTLLSRSNNLLPRAMYNDSYEVYKANWTTAFFDAFRKRHQYDLKEIIYVVSPGYPDGLLKQNVTSDFRETLASLHYEGAATWVTWCANHKLISRYQSHGSPGNLLDLYALADIPETESFGSSAFTIPLVRTDPDFEPKNFGRPNPLMMKFASSPAHLLGKKLVASESTTWLGNHFKVALSQIMP
ncbi:MAG: glycosyl hydrolase [Mariniphaga sp.]